MIRIVKKQSKYGGADSPLDVIVVKWPISEMMVGTKSGSDAKDTLYEKYISAGKSDLGSLNAARHSLSLKPVPLGSAC